MEEVGGGEGEPEGEVGVHRVPQPFTIAQHHALHHRAG